MRIRIVTKNIELTPEIRSYVNDAVNSLNKYFSKINPDEILAEIDLGRPSTHHRKGDVFRCEINLTVRGKLLRAEERGTNLMEAIDKVIDEIERRVRRTKEKKKTEFLKGARKLADQIKFFRFKK